MNTTKAKTKVTKENNQMLIDTPRLMELLCCGYPTANKIGNQAGAKVQSGRRVLWNVKKLQNYIDSISE